ncbi:TPA: GlsB/YeaQ/YmgE family stress response membrane protein [Patescibacteria group bacterium]|nr:MAG: Membrane protein [Parcubacteria group bacterium GW2011_GWD2_42_14]HCC05598.1 GlsB/YeaQ/YmgE family stress response membrane protein [Patescibacteria group bacterium]
MNFLTWIIVGAITGWILSISVRYDIRQNKVLYVILGIDGAVLGGWLVCYFSRSSMSVFNMYSAVVAVFGAVVLVSLVRELKIIK